MENNEVVLNLEVIAEGVFDSIERFSNAIGEDVSDIFNEVLKDNREETVGEILVLLKDIPVDSLEELISEVFTEQMFKANLGS